jgi:hypothetical protein
MGTEGRNAFDVAPGVRRVDLAGLPPDDFEELVHRLVRVTYPTARHTGNPDKGADTLLPKSDEQGWERAWQARRYSTADSHWKRCEEALDDAVKAYEITHYTFVFPRNLTGGPLQTFDKRLKTRRAGVTVDFWDLSEMLVQLDETAAGRRVARAFFGMSREEFDESMRAAIASGAADMKDGNDVMGRLQAVATWLELNGGSAWKYATSTWQTGVPEAPSAPGAVISRYEQGEHGHTRIDAFPADDVSKVVMPSVRIEFDPDEKGRAAHDALMDAERRNVSVSVSEGFAVIFEDMPSLWMDENGNPMRDVTLELTPTLPSDAKPIKGMIRAQTDDGPVTLDVTMEPVLREEWSLAWRVTISGLVVDFALRARPDGAEGVQAHLGFTHELLDTATVRAALPAVRFAEAASRAHTLEVVPETGEPMPFKVPKPVPANGLRGLVPALEAAEVVEEWTGEPLPISFVRDEEELSAVLMAANLIVAEEAQGSIAGARYVLGPEAKVLDGDPKELRLAVAEDVGISIGDREIWLGHLLWHIEGVAWETEPDKSGGVVLVAPEDVSSIKGVLQRGKVPRPPASAN